MPPWHVDPDVGIQQFKNDASLNDEQIKAISAWVDAGAPEGDPADMPPPVELPSGADWQLAEQLGPPDFIVRSRPYDVIANGQDQWWEPRVEFSGLENERWLRAAEFKPSYPLGKKVVHHGHAVLMPRRRAALGGAGALRRRQVQGNVSRGHGDAGAPRTALSPGTCTIFRSAPKLPMTWSRSASGFIRKTNAPNW